MRAARGLASTLAACMAVLWAGSAAHAGGKVAVAITQSAKQIGQYERLELTVELGKAFANPFDPNEISLEASFHTPAGKIMTVPAFYALPYTRSQGEEGAEVLTPAGSGRFHVRFAAREVGEYRYDVTARERGVTRRLGRGRFQATRSARPGFVHIGAKSHRYFGLDSGHPYFAIGENMCWPNRNGTYDYDRWLGKLAEHGGNYVRLWLINDWNPLGLENRAQTEDGEENGLGRYSQRPAWRVDHIIETGERLGVRALMCIDSFNSLSTGPNPMWERSPYNAANGGPCAKPEDFFTNAEAKRLFRQRLRYLVARWGYSTSVLGWEFWNEVDLTDSYDSPAVTAWHKEMAEYLRRIDPWQHPITTSYSSTAGDPNVLALPQLDFLQTHNYGAHDIAGMATEWTHRQLDRYHKPYFLGEYGADVRGSSSDPEGAQLHNGLWAGLLSGAPGTAMLWYWDWVDQRDLYHEFAPVAAFAKGVDWAKEEYAPLAVASVQYRDPSAPATYGTLTIDPTTSSWEDGSPLLQPRTVIVGTDGVVRGTELLNAFVHGSGHANWRNPITFEVDYPQAGRFEVVVAEISRFGGARLVISVDGKEALAQDLQAPPRRPRGAPRPAEPPPTPIYGVEVPAGKHRIVVDSQGQDWFRASYRLVGYLRVPNLRVLALGNRHGALVWVQNREHTWWNAARGLVTPVRAATITLPGFASGAYEVEQWDTYVVKITSHTKTESHDGVVVLTTPEGLLKDLAYRVRRAR